MAKKGTGNLQAVEGNGQSNGVVPTEAPGVTLVPLSELEKAEIGPIGQRLAEVKAELVDTYLKATRLKQRQAELETIYVQLEKDANGRIHAMASNHGLREPWNFSSDSMAFTVPAQGVAVS